MLAIATWLSAQRDADFSGLNVTLVDRANWGPTRQSVLYPVLEHLDVTIRSQFHEARLDVASSEGLQHLVDLAHEADVIVCPSLFTELAVQDSRGQVLHALGAAMRADSVLVIADHDVPNRPATQREIATHFTIHEHGRAEVLLPPPPPAIRREYLRNEDYLRHKKNYQMEWNVLSPLRAR